MDLRKKILEGKDFEIAPLDVPGWEESYIKTASVEETFKILSMEEGARKAVAQIIACVTDKEGVPVFTEEDTENLMKKDFHVLIKIIEKINKLHGIDEPLEEIGKK